MLWLSVAEQREQSWEEKLSIHQQVYVSFPTNNQQLSSDTEVPKHLQAAWDVVAWKVSPNLLKKNRMVE